MAIPIYVEVRPNIRACSFFFKTSVKIEPSSVKVGPMDVEIDNSTLGALRVELPSIITLVPESLSGLSCSNGVISFRTRIATFFASSGVKHHTTYSLDVPKTRKVKLVCSICQEHLSGELSFSRILPLPSTEQLDGFFCHRQSDNKISLDPRPSDLFYNFFFFKINVENLQIPESVNQFKCPRCSTCHGEVNGKCVKLWNSTVHISASPFTQASESVLDSFLRSLTYFVKDIPNQMNKFVFICSEDNSSTRYTLVWVLDRSLVLLSGIYHPRDESVNMDLGSVMKVLYRHYAEDNDEVNEWLGSFSSSVIPIPPKVELELLKYLAKMSEEIPSNCVNGMNISFLQSNLGSRSF